MGLAELALLAVGLSMDAFAVSICKGLGMKKINLKVAVVLGLFFGGFQAGMPVIGWALGSQFMGIIGPIDHLDRLYPFGLHRRQDAVGSLYRRRG